MIDLLRNGRRHQTNGLSAPVRNKYFYGKLLDADHLDLEQHYFLEMDRLVNRLTLGTGVLCGLRAVEDQGKVTVSPGVAIDGHGRVLLVTEQLMVDPWSLEGEDGTAIGESDDLILLLCYHECDAEPAPVLIADCEIREQCVPGVVRERYALRVVTTDAWEENGHVTGEQCAAIFGGADPRRITESVPHLSAWASGEIGRTSSAAGAPADSPFRALLGALLRGSCAPGPDCVPIARITRVKIDDQVTLNVDEWGPRTTIYSNTVLLDLILCLAAHMEACCRRGVTLTAPRIEAMDPAPGTTVKRTRTDVQDELFSLTFDRDMDLGRLKQSADWMRVVVKLVEATPAGATLLPVMLTDDSTATRAVFKLTEEGRAELARQLEANRPSGLQAIVVIRSDDLTQIADAGNPPEILDADYAGTFLKGVGQIEALWWLDPDLKLPLPAIAARPTLDPPNGTPAFVGSGNGIEGGIFHAWFQVRFHD